MAKSHDAEDLAAQLREGADASALADLEGINLRGADLRGADLSTANLRGADLSTANLERANLRETDFTRSDLIGADLRDADLTRANLIGADLSEANLHDADLRGACLSVANLSNANLGSSRLDSSYLSEANLRNADLRNADLRGAHLYRAYLVKADLSNADLREADLTMTYVVEADLSGANLSGAYLRGAYLRGTELRGTNFRGATMINLELPPGITAAHDVALVTVDWRTVARSLRWIGLRELLVRTGMPELAAIHLIKSLRTVDKMDIFTMLQSTFISYGSPDEDFARKLRNALERHGVKTWFFPEDAVPGERLHRVMSKGVREHDRVILICSSASLPRAGVLNELEQALAREASEGGTQVIIPVRLDDGLFTAGWAGEREDLREQLCNRVVADFRGTATDEKKFEAQLAKLVRALGPKATAS